AAGQASGVLQLKLARLDSGLLATALLLVERDAGFLHQLLGQAQALAGEDEVRVLRRPRVMARLELGQERCEGVGFRTDRRTDAIPGHGFGQCALDRKSTRLNSSHVKISYAVF